MSQNKIVGIVDFSPSLFCSSDALGKSADIEIAGYQGTLPRGEYQSGTWNEYSVHCFTNRLVTWWNNDWLQDFENGRAT